MSNRDFKLKMDKIQLISYKLGSFPVFLIQQMALPSTQLLKQETYVTLGFSLSPSLITAGQLLSPINYTFLNVIQISPLLSIQWPPCSCLPGLLYLPPVNWSPWAPLIKFPFSPHASSPPIHFLHSSQNYLPKRNYILWLLKTLQLVGTTLGGKSWLLPFSLASSLSHSPLPLLCSFSSFTSTVWILFRHHTKVTDMHSSGFRVNISSRRSGAPVLFTWRPELTLS